MAKETYDKKELFESMPIPKALATLAIPTIISQMINVIYNMVDTFFIGRTGNSYMLAATTLTMTMTFLCVAFSNLFGLGGGSLVARLLGAQRPDEAKSVSAFSIYGAIAISIVYSALIAIFMDPVLVFLGASPDTIGFTRQYTVYVVVIGTVFTTLSITMAHLLRNTGNASKASIGLSGGGILNMFLDPLFMFVILPKGQEVVGAAIATLLSNICSFIYLFIQVVKASRTAPLSFRLSDARKVKKDNVKKLFAVGVPSALLSAFFDVANICANQLAAAHSDVTLAALGIVMKIERIPNGVNVGIGQGMLPIVAYNYASGNHKRMREAIKVTRIIGLITCAICICLLEIFAKPITNFFLSTRGGDPSLAIATVTVASVFLRMRCTASPFMFLSYSNSYIMQATGHGGATLLHAFAREVIFYIPCLFLLDRVMGQNGLAAALPVGECFGAIVGLVLVHYILKKAEQKKSGI
ncbi:MAG: polysaccharide biosynthesis C-terminal domain-containing protein [Firmicutes bacterium]|nr:polysaccharide biosynthesis C-terminal domain-containing protein [Bacillota bacterium]